MRHAHEMPFGAQLLPGGGVLFSYWSPQVTQLQLDCDGAAPLPMARNDDGWHRLKLSAAGVGTRYRFVLPDGTRMPDPASRSNPDDVQGASEVIDPLGYDWQDSSWRGRPWTEAVIYELHVGCFTPEGSFAAAMARLPELVSLGITAIELMPVAEFAGQRGWGYDGVLLFAPESSYGRPEALKAFVDRAHQLGLMVLLDVVYNHFGPEGNYLHAGSPSFFHPAKDSPWGASINFDGEDAGPVRAFFIHNALYWCEEFRFDGLRLDAVHALHDRSPTHIVEDICAALQAGPGRERPIHIVLENDDNRAHGLARDGAPAHRPRHATAQWNDDLHHAAHVLLTGECDGYYADYAEQPLTQFGRALAEGFVYQGQPSAFREGAARGEPSGHLPLAAFVSYLQTHDQVGNRAFGDRLARGADPTLLRAAYACLLLSPHTPMLFMGEEFGASAPFLYFCDFEPALAEAVRAGRRAEFGQFAAFTKAQQDTLPDPNALATFEASKLDWQEQTRPPHDALRVHIAVLLALRQNELVPLFGQQAGNGRHWLDRGTLRVDWPLAAQRKLRLLANFGAEPLHGVAALPGRVIYQNGVQTDGPQHLQLAPGAVCVALEEPASNA